MDYHKSDLKDECMNRYFYSFSLMLDKSDYVPERTMKRIARSLDKDWAQSVREIDREYRRYKWQKFWRSVKDRRAERKTKRAEARAERKTKRAEACAERKAKRDEARKAFREKIKAARAAKRGKA